jgi:hypothetical protein
MGAALARYAAEDTRREPLLDDTPPPTPMAFDTEERPSFIRHEGRWLGWTLVVVGLVAALVMVGISLNSTGVITLPGTHDSPARTTPKTSAPAPAALQLQRVEAYDPFGSPRSENDADASKAADGDPATSWNTEHYKSPEFGRLKPGVGLVLDAGSPQQVSRIDLRLVAPGASIEVYGTDSVPTSFDQWGTRLASRSDAPKNFSVDLSDGTNYQYYLVWFTKLPPAPDGHQFQDGIAEAILRS